MPSWAANIHPEYSVPVNQAEWQLEIEDKDGVPWVKSLTPKAKIIHLFWKKHHDNLHIRGMRLRPDRLVFHLKREKDNPHDFDELYPEMQKWLPKWAEHFGVPQIEMITVEYVNILDGNITPQFLQADGSLQIGKALKIFSQFPGDHKGLTYPYDCKVRLVLNDEKTRFMDLNVLADSRSRNAVRFDIKVLINLSNKTANFQEALEEIKIGHEAIIKQFSCFFTDEAKTSFLPV